MEDEGSQELPKLG